MPSRETRCTPEQMKVMGREDFASVSRETFVWEVFLQDDAASTHALKEGRGGFWVGGLEGLKKMSCST